MNDNLQGFMGRLTGRGRDVVGSGLLLVFALLTSHSSAFALNPALEVSQYAHTAWRIREGFSPGTVFAMGQTPDGYLWLGSEFGLFLFDGVRFIPWKPPAGERLPSNPYSLIVTRDGAVWIGTYAGLVSWKGAKLTRYPQLDGMFVTSLLEDREGTVWAGVLSNPAGRLCAIRSGQTQCYVEDGAFGSFVWSLGEDSAGALWASAESGVWRWKPGPPRQYATPGMRPGDVSKADDGRVLVGMSRAGLRQLVGDNFEAYPLRVAMNSDAQMPEHDVDSNKLLRDRDGGLWIGTHTRGIIHVRRGRADVFTKSDGLSGDTTSSLFEDREGNIWVATAGGLDRFRELPITNVSTKQGLSSDAVQSVLGATDGSIWIATRDGLTQRKVDQTKIFRKANGLPDDSVQSLFEDKRGRIWAFTDRGLAYLENGKFVAVNGVPSGEVYSITGDKAGNLWLSGNKGLTHLRDGRLVEHLAWSALGRQQQAKVILSDEGGVWLSFWQDGGVLYFKDGEVRASYTPADGLGKGHVPGLQLAGDGALWAATEEGGLSRIKDGRVTTLTTENGLPCNAIHSTIEDDDRSLWLYTACGLVRIARSEVDAWVADPQRGIETTLWDARDGVRLGQISPATFGPAVAKSGDGKLWFLTGEEGIAVVDPHHLAANKLPPPVHIEQITADGKTYDASQGLRLPAGSRDVVFHFTALTLAEPDKVRFRVKLEGQDEGWRELVNQRQVNYTNLSPMQYQFRVLASNNSGVWNEEGALLRFSIEPTIYQKTWFRVACVALFLALLWAGYQFRVRQLRRQEKRLRDVIEGMPTMAFVFHRDGSPDLVNRRWLDYTGLSADAAADGRGWEATIHPEDAEAHLDKWRAALSSGEPFENEVRHRDARGEYRWFLVRIVPFRDRHGRIGKWYGSLTDIEDRKRAEKERERLQRLEAELAHTNRVSMLGELAASLTHEINQPIAAAITSAGAAMRWLDRDQPEVDKAREAVKRIEHDGKRAADIIAHLKSFYKKDVSPQREVVAVNEIVGDMLVLLHSEAVRHSVVMRTELAADLQPVRADRVQLQQVLMNLMLNGIEAMKEAGGELTIRTQREDGKVLVSVSDTGVGLPAGQTEQIFNAFVTTKPGGTGMGLAISRSIIEAHGGRLWAMDNEGRGASFHFSLPPAEM